MKQTASVAVVPAGAFRRPRPHAVLLLAGAPIIWPRGLVGFLAVLWGARVPGVPAGSGRIRLSSSKIGVVGRPTHLERSLVMNDP